MPRIEVGKEETHRDRFYSFRLQGPRRLSHFILVQRNQHCSLRGNETFCHNLAVTAPRQGAVLPRDFLLDGIVLRALVTTNMEDITIPLGGNHADPRSFVLEQGVSRDSGPVIDLMNIAWLDPMALAELSDAGNNANRRVCRCGGDFVD